MKTDFLRILPVCLVLVLASVAMPAGAMVNPSALYCTQLGYQYTDTVAADGSMAGNCLLPGNQSVEAWQFLEGKAAPDLSYCRKQGMEIRTVNDPAVCGMLGDTCAVCVKPDGTTQEVTKIMGLDFREKICSGNVCCDPVKDTTCPIGSESGPVAGGQQNETLPIVPIAIVVILIAAALAILYMRKKKEPRPEEKTGP